MTGDLITIDILLSYIYNRFAATYLVCFLGVLIGKMAQSLSVTAEAKRKPSRMNMLYLLLQPTLVTVIVCALQDYAKITSFNMYVLVCIISGMWSPSILKAITSTKIVGMFLIKISKKVKDPIVASIGDTIEELEQDKKKNKKKGTDDTQSHERGDGS